MRQKVKDNLIRISALFVLCILCVAMILGGQMTAPVAYADTVIGNVQMDSSNVMDDLQNSTIDGIKFDISNYAFDENQPAQVFMFAEYCYSFYTNLRGNYGLYVYVYNPQRLKFKTNSTLNTISIRAGADDSVGYTKYTLLYLNQCEIPNYEGMFLKFKVILSGEQKEQIFDRLASDKRVYDVSEIELVADSETKSQYYYVGTEYTFEGYAKGYGSDLNGESTLVCTDEQSEALTLDVRSTYYRPDGTSGEAYTRDTLHSVYFAVPQRILDAYPTVSKVHATWLNAQTAPIFVTGNEAVRNAVLPYIGQTVDGGQFMYAKDDNSPVPYALIASKYIESASWNNAAYGVSYMSYNANRSYTNSDTELKQLQYCFLATDESGNTGTDVADTYIVRAEDLLGNKLTGEKGYFAEYTEQHGGELVMERYSKALFASVADAATDIWIEADDTFTLTDEVISQDLWQKFVGGGYNVTATNTYKVSAIKQVTEEDLQGSPAEVCNRLYIDESDYAEFLQFYNDAVTVDESNPDDEQMAVVLFRYYQSEYPHYEVAEYERGEGDWTLTGTAFGYDFIDTNAYFMQMWVQLGFDIIDIEFSNGEKILTLGVAMSPMDVSAGGGQTLFPSSDKDTVAWWKIVLAVLALIVLLVILMPILPYIIKLVVWVIMLPFRLIAAIVKGIQKAAKKKPKQTEVSPLKAVQAKPPKANKRKY